MINIIKKISLSLSLILVFSTVVYGSNIGKFNSTGGSTLGVEVITGPNYKDTVFVDFKVVDEQTGDPVKDVLVKIPVNGQSNLVSSKLTNSKGVIEDVFLTADSYKGTTYRLIFEPNSQYYDNKVADISIDTGKAKVLSKSGNIASVNFFGSDYIHKTTASVTVKFKKKSQTSIPGPPVESPDEGQNTSEETSSDKESSSEQTSDTVTEITSDKINNNDKDKDDKLNKDELDDINKDKLDKEALEKENLKKENSIKEKDGQKELTNDDIKSKIIENMNKATGQDPALYVPLSNGVSKLIDKLASNLIDRIKNPELKGDIERIFNFSSLSLNEGQGNDFLNGELEGENGKRGNIFDELFTNNVDRPSFGYAGGEACSNHVNASIGTIGVEVGFLSLFRRRKLYLKELARQIKSLQK